MFRVGLTYDLRSAYLAEGYSLEETAEFDREDTIEAIAGALQEFGYQVDRIGHCRNLMQRLLNGDRWELVFNICEGLHGLGREAQVPALLDAYQIPYTFAGPLMMSVCLHKGLTKTILAGAGLPTAKFFVANRLEDLWQWRPNFGFPMFVKPVAEGTGKGVTAKSRVSNRKQLLETGEELLHQFRQPILIEQYLSGREFTVGIWGSGEEAEVIGTLEILLLESAEAGIYSYANKENYTDRVRYQPVTGDGDPEVAAAERLALAAWRKLEGVDAGRIDIRSDALGRPHFIEVNPLAGLHPIHSDLPMICTAFGHRYQDLIQRIVRSASLRADLEDGSPSRIEPPETSSLADENQGNRPIRIAILHQQVAEDSLSAETDVLDQVMSVQQSLLRQGFGTAVIECTMELDRLVDKISASNCQLVFNLVESMGGTDRLMPMVPSLLDQQQIPYTGASSAALIATTHKVAAKQALHQAGLPTPAWFCPLSRNRSLPAGNEASLCSSVPSKSPRLQRVILKAIWEHASFALDEGAVVNTDGSRSLLRTAIRNRQALIGCPVFAEEFIEGREFNLSIIGSPDQPWVLPPAEIDFSGFLPEQLKIVGYRAKWDTSSFEYRNTPRRFDFPQHDRRLLKELKSLALSCWKLFELSGYARVDFRVDRLGRPWILEVNANPCLTPDAGFAAALQQAGLSYDAGICWIVDQAWHQFKSSRLTPLPSQLTET